MNDAPLLAELADAEDAIDGQIARARLADIKSGRARIVRGAELADRLSAWEAE